MVEEDKKKKKKKEPIVFGGPVGTGELDIRPPPVEIPPIKTAEDVPPVREPAYPGEVVTPEFFSPSAKKIIPGGGFRGPRPELGEQVIGTSPEIEIEKQREQLLLEETPERRELDPERILFEKIPFAGGFVSAGKTLGGFVKQKLGFKTVDQKRFDPNSFRTAELAAIAKEEADRGITFNEVLGAYVEALPTGDSVLGISFAKTLEKPSENANQVATNIRKIKRQISNIETNVRTGYLPVATAQDQIVDMEANVIRLESRLKSLVNNSPSLKFNSDLVNTFETDILIIKEKLLQSKLNILAGKIQDPDEMEIFLKAKRLEESSLDDFEAGV